MTQPICYLDTETTGLDLYDDIWEFAAVKFTLSENPDKGLVRDNLHLFIAHSTDKCSQLPEPFRSDHRARFPAACSKNITAREDAAHFIYQFTKDATILGCVPNFDTERIERLIRRNTSRTPDWHYHLGDVENMAVGYLLAAAAFGPALTGLSRDRLRAACAPPWDSEELSLALGVDPMQFVRHTAMGDVEWAMAMHEAMRKGMR